jgi:hypothetical protein
MCFPALRKLSPRSLRNWFLAVGLRKTDNSLSSGETMFSCVEQSRVVQAEIGGALERVRRLQDAADGGRCVRGSDARD